MSNPSNWPLPPESIRFVVPRRIVQQLADHPLSRGLYPLGIGYYHQASGHHMERVEHDDYLLIYCLEGAGLLQVEGLKYSVHAGDLVLLPKGVSHSYRALKSRPWTIYWAHFHGDDADAFYAHLSEPRQSAPILLTPLGLQSRLASDFEALLELRESTYNLSAYLCAANQLRQILTHIALLQPLARNRQKGDSLDLERVHSLMQAHVHEHLALDTLADSVNLSKYHFVKRYKELTGTTPINHFIQLKIERACHLLDTTSNSINEIAFAVGYEDAYYFSRIFKKIMGVSPSQYRNLRTGAYAYRGGSTR
ncbi:MmsAB operon regulatory protein [Marinobacterium zhoushanense]|uniref:MmsAB operon regulatory protein n=1 Tax=Marinobacterium zhoushanense TaxID=1679163 RepID=A0ABQ1KCE4_9GAMM|nr:AraC family transcriptional regulator [Marinobacterium zhoushanense]GGB91677.1 MmsAB operon regulatory protein [Marinobacterium zhoushanense]